MSTKKSTGGLKYFSEENSGFKIAPKTVLIMSLIYIGIVVLLHIYSKIGTSKPVTADSTSQQPGPESATPEPSDAGQPETEPVPEPEEAEPNDL